MKELCKNACLILLLAAAPASCPASAGQLQGDPRAVAAVERLIERFGGREVWSRAKGLYIQYDGWRTEPNEPVQERAWRNFDVPYQRSEFEGRSFFNAFAISPDGGWISRNGELTIMDEEQHQRGLDGYPYGFYNSIHTFAKGDPSVQLAWQEPDRVIVTGPDGRERGWWQIDETGAVIKWGVTDFTDGEELEYIYGPMRRFGNINFPAWGTSADGWWRWDYVDVQLSVEPLSFSVDPPAGAK